MIGVWPHGAQVTDQVLPNNNGATLAYTASFFAERLITLLIQILCGKQKRPLNQRVSGSEGASKMRSIYGVPKVRVTEPIELALWSSAHISNYSFSETGSGATCSFSFTGKETTRVGTSTLTLATTVSTALSASSTTAFTESIDIRAVAS